VTLGRTAPPDPTKGTGPGGRITRDDLESRFRGIQGEVETVEQEALHRASIASAAVVVVVVVVIFWLGKRRGVHSRTVVEVRRL
jgi:hypothetical protein